MNHRTTFIGLTAVLIVLATIITPFPGEESDGCVRCHSGFEVFPVEFVTPNEVPIGEFFEVSLVITSLSNNEDSGDDDDDGYPHELRDIVVELNMDDSPNLELVNGTTRMEPPDVSSGSSRTLIWLFKAQEAGDEVLRVEVTATVYYKHSSNNPDTHRYQVAPPARMIRARPLPIRLSSYSLTAMAGNERIHEVILSAKEPITDLGFELTDEVRLYTELTFPDANDSLLVPPFDLEEGDWLFMKLVLFSADKGADGSLKISWTNFSGVGQSINLTISIIKEPDVAGNTINWFSVSGQVSGILLLGFFIASVTLGGFPNHAKAFFRSRGLTSKKRVDLHCNVSYFIIALTLFHMLVLLAGPWRDSMFGQGINNGYVGLSLFVLLGFHGRYQRNLIKKWGFKNWIWGHRFLTLGILLIGLIHAYRIGTHFEIFRGLT